MTSEELTLAMVAILNEGVAGIPVPDLRNLASGILMAKGTPGALRVGNMLLELIALNQRYSEELGQDPAQIGIGSGV